MQYNEAIALTALCGELDPQMVLAPVAALCPLD